MHTSQTSAHIHTCVTPQTPVQSANKFRRFSTNPLTALDNVAAEVNHSAVHSATHTHITHMHTGDRNSRLTQHIVERFMRIFFSQHDSAAVGVVVVVGVGVAAVDKALNWHFTHTHRTVSSIGVRAH